MKSTTMFSQRQGCEPQAQSGLVCSADRSRGRVKVHAAAAAYPFKLRVWAFRGRQLWYPFRLPHLTFPLTTSGEYGYYAATVRLGTLT